MLECYNVQSNNANMLMLIRYDVYHVYHLWLKL